ncbi:alpha/beta fold hydrolase [Streptomyces sp. NBS 14/10]|nr:alpha/beta fold hydrolase [Streptomyces sp. NBS 14/10]KAK1186148.1 alpha/beta fold hydrolase [Streptomyces sp. NBS 14/10]NUP44821.1 alpha/beta fold hydrolase [Streptomyces sp.]NUS90412.1 alpha/beta fold hydrolase [Streptomyces sp.]
MTDDGVAIEAVYAPFQPYGAGSGTGTDPGPAIVVAHGFTGALERPALRRAAAALGRHAAVVTFSFRGHGRSAGRSTVGDREVLDLATAVRWARRLGHRRIATVGFSMGGSVVLRHAALYGAGALGGKTGTAAPGALEAKAGAGAREAAHTDAAVAVSAAARWYYRGTAPMRRVHWAITRPAGRLVSRYGLRTRIDSRGWDPEPLSPVAAAPLIAPTPLLIVHGDQDPYFPLDHPRTLVDAADPSSTELWIEPGFGHAENAAGPALLGRIAAWATAHV